MLVESLHDFLYFKDLNRNLQAFLHDIEIHFTTLIFNLFEIQTQTSKDLKQQKLKLHPLNLLFHNFVQ